MKKLAKDNPAWLFLPGHRLLGLDPDDSKLPRVFSDDADNTTLWGTLGAVTSVGALTAILTRMANKRARAHLEDKQREQHAAKVNSLYPAAEADSTLGKSASAPGPMSTVIPIAAAIAAGLGTSALAAKSSEKEYSDDLDAKIAAQRKKLQGLYTRLEEIYKSGDNSTISKSASDPSFTGRVLTVAALGLLATGALGLYGGYQYTKKHSDEHAVQKVLEDNLLADNLTNIPDNIAMQLDPRAKK